MKRKFTNFILILIFLIGLSVVLYPSISNYWNSKTQSKAIVNYDERISQMDESQFTKYFEEAEEYNKKLAELNYPLSEYRKLGGYEDLLNVMNNGMIGYIYIEKIKVELPIYHGTSDEVLDVAAGHIEGSSLPIGGKSTHAALSSHRGLPSAKLFTNLDQLQEGDKFVVTVLNRKCTYQVDQIRIVEPKDTSYLAIEEGEDYCTLITCTPYGINSHRMLVRGHRVENDVNNAKFITADALKLDAFVVAPIIALPMLLILIICLFVKYRKKGKKKVKGVEEK